MVKGRLAGSLSLLNQEVCLLLTYEENFVGKNLYNAPTVFVKYDQ